MQAVIRMARDEGTPSPAGDPASHPEQVTCADHSPRSRSDWGIPNRSSALDRGLHRWPINLSPSLKVLLHQ